MRPCAAALHKDQGMVNSKAHTALESGEAINLAVAVQEPLQSAAAMAREVGKTPINFNTQHPVGAKLIIVANLAAAEEPIYRMGAFQTKGAARGAGRTAAAAADGDTSWVSATLPIGVTTPGG